MKWPTSTGKYTTPPIQKTDGSLAKSNEEKENALKQVFFTPTSQIFSNGSTTRLADLEIESRDSIMKWHTCSSKEVEETILHADNIPQGVDEALPLIIKKALPILGNKITLLFQFCLNKRYHLTVFKTAILFALPKLGNRPKCPPRSYCLILLLSHLETVLEKIVARRLARIALKF